MDALVQGNEHTTESGDFQNVLKAFEIIRKKKEGQYRNNIIETCHKSFNMEKDLTEKTLDEAVYSKILKEVRVNGKLSYRLYNSQAIIKDAVCDRSVQVEMEGNPQLVDDFLDFKKFITTEMGVVKSQLVKDLHPTNSLVDALLQRIKSLENQLDQKQTIIELLINKTNNINNAAHVAETMPENVNLKHKTDNSTPLVHNISRDVITVDNKKDNTHLKQNQSRNIINNKSSNARSTVDTRTTVKKSVVIIGDSIINGIEPKGLSKGNSVKVTAHPGASSRDIVDHIRPVARQKPDIVIIHCGTNDLKGEINTSENLEAAIKHLKETSPHTKISISSLVTRKDKVTFDIKVNDTNEKLEQLCKKEKVDLICNNNIDQSCLSSKQLHLNRKGSSYLANNFIKYINSA